MTTYSTSEFKNGLKILLDGVPMSIVENQIVKPGKGQAFNRVKFKNLRSGRIIEKTFKSGESVDGADVSEIEGQYLYSDGTDYHFMNPSTFEQYIANESAVEEAKHFLKEQDICVLTLFNGTPLTVVLPNFVELKIVETDPGVKGDTAGTGGKPAVLETGATVRVPLFVQQDEIIKVDTRTGEYVSRAK